MVMKDTMKEIKTRMGARVKAEPVNLDAWRELAQVNSQNPSGKV